jgi:hypothetical protein
MSLRREHDERRFVVFYQDYRKGGLDSIKPEEGVSVGMTECQCPAQRHGCLSAGILLCRGESPCASAHLPAQEAPDAKIAALQRSKGRQKHLT